MDKSQNAKMIDSFVVLENDEESNDLARLANKSMANSRKTSDNLIKPIEEVRNCQTSPPQEIPMPKKPVPPARPKRVESFADKTAPKLVQPSDCFFPDYCLLIMCTSSTRKFTVEIIGVGEGRIEAKLMAGKLTSETFTYYKIRVDPDLSKESEVITIDRRYSNFVALNDRLMKTEEGHLLPALPASGIPYPRARRFLLQNYLRKLASFVSLNEAKRNSKVHDVLRDFLTSPKVV